MDTEPVGRVMAGKWVAGFFCVNARATGVRHKKRLFGDL
jgi:hypothetical protein